MRLKTSILSVNDADISEMRHESANSTIAEKFVFSFQNFPYFNLANKKTQFHIVFEIRH